jgi:hypothetical protein
VAAGLEENFMNPDRKALDLTTGTIWKALLLYFLPILAGALFQKL